MSLRSKRKLHQIHGPRAATPSHAGHAAPDRRPTIEWPALAAYNALPASQRLEALKDLGIEETDKEVLGILTKSHFVIPGQTRFQCKQCGECCRYARKVAQLTYEPCPFLTSDNLCAKHENHYNVCKWFPFWVYKDPVRGPLLTVKPYCTGYGEGPLVDYSATMKRLLQLSIEETEENDGASVIHEVLHIPGRPDWMFPSRANIDALMQHIREEARRTAVELSPERSQDRAGEVHYAQHCTSGLLGSANAPLLTVNEIGLVTDANEAACKLTGLDLPALTGKAFSMLFVNQDRVKACLKSCFARGKETASPQRLKLESGATAPVLIDGMTFRDRSDGLVHCVLLCIHPVSTAAYAELNQSRNYARGLLEASLDALMVIDRDGAIIDLNEAVVQMSGISRESLLGSPFKDLFIESDKAQRGVEQTFEQGVVRNYVLKLHSTHGEQIPVSFNATVYRDEEGVVQGIFAAARDIRERLKMIQELEEAKYYARGLIECCLDLMVTIDPAGIVTDANNAACTMTGYGRDELIGAPFKRFFDDGDRAAAGVAETFRNGEVRNYTMNLLTADKTSVPVSFNATLYRDAAGTVQGVFAIARSQA